MKVTTNKSSKTALHRRLQENTKSYEEHYIALITQGLGFESLSRNQGKWIIQMDSPFFYYMNNYTLFIKHIFVSLQCIHGLLWICLHDKDFSIHVWYNSCYAQYYCSERHLHWRKYCIYLCLERT